MDQNGLLDAVDVSARLRRACQEAGSEPAFARRIGVSPQFVSAVMHAKRAPTPAMLAAVRLKRIVRYVDIDAADKNEGSPGLAPEATPSMSISDCLRAWMEKTS